MNYYLGPYQWVDNSWQPPTSTIGSIDLRNLSHMGTPIIQNGVGFFATINALSGYTLLGRGDLREINSTSLMKSAWNSELGYSPNGDKLVDLLYDQLTMGSDPRGISGPKPLMPSKGNLELHLSNHSIVKGKQFRIGHSPETNKVLLVYKENYRQIRQDVLDSKLPINHHRKVLDFWGKQFKIKNPENVFIPNDLPKETRVPHDTLISENFDGTDSGTLGKELTWVEGGGGSIWDNFNNHARVNVDGDPDARSAYANSALSSADQQCVVTSVVQGNSIGLTNVAASCRRSSSAITFYSCLLERLTSSDKFFIQKVVSNVVTTLNLPGIDVTASIPDTLKFEIIGSSLEIFFNSVSRDTVTDTAITGNLFCGIYGRNSSGASAVEFDNWSAQDIVADDATGSSFLLGLI